MTEKPDLSRSGLAGAKRDDAFAGRSATRSKGTRTRRRSSLSQVPGRVRPWQGFHGQGEAAETANKPLPMD